MTKQEVCDMVANELGDFKKKLEAKGIKIEEISPDQDPFWCEPFFQITICLDEDFYYDLKD